MTPFTYLEPEGVEAALALLQAHGDDAKVIAGGTGLINLMKQRLVQPAVVIGTRRLDALRGMAVDDTHLRIGALTTLRQIEEAAPVRQFAGLLGQVCHHVATVRIRGMATIGGAISHADPNLDTPPALIALDGEIHLRSAGGARVLPMDQFFRGYYETALEPDELVTEIRIPRPAARCGTAAIKFLPGSADDYATVSVCARLTLAEDGRIADARVALGAVAATPVRAVTVEAALVGQRPDDGLLRDAAAGVIADIDPITDLRGSADYKRQMATVHLHRALAAALAAATLSGSTLA